MCGAEPMLTHPDRILWPASHGQPALTKADLAAWYDRYARPLLEHAGGRPLALVRAPEGLEGERFFQRHPMRGQSRAIGTLRMPGQTRPYLRVDTPEGLQALAQLSVLELHPAGARAEAPEWPDRLVLDLDPGEGVPFALVASAGLELRDRLAQLGLPSFPRITGGKGLHLVVPLARSREDAMGWPEAKRFVHLLCTLMERDSPDRYTTALAKKARPGRIFLDYLRNDLLATAIAGFSPRARPGAPVALPIGWRHVETGRWGRRALRPDALHLTEGLQRRVASPWPDLDVSAAPLRPALARLLREQGGGPD